MLAALEPASLARMRFPLGDLTKPEVRRIAADAGLPVASKVDSQDLCFLAGTDARALPRPPRRGRRAPGRDRRPRGRRPRHATPVSTCSPSGSGAGLGVANGEPLYVLEKDAERNRVVVGHSRRARRPRRPRCGACACTVTAHASTGSSCATGPPRSRPQIDGALELRPPFAGGGHARRRRRRSGARTARVPARWRSRRRLGHDRSAAYRIAPDCEVQGLSDRGCRGPARRRRHACGAGWNSARACAELAYRRPVCRLVVLVRRPAGDRDSGLSPDRSRVDRSDRRRDRRLVQLAPGRGLDPSRRSSRAR